MREAVIEKADHEAAFQEFNTAISADHRSAWTVEMEKWEENPNDTSLTNPLECKSIRKFCLTIQIIFTEASIKKSRKLQPVSNSHRWKLKNLLGELTYLYTPTSHQVFLSRQV